MFFSLPSKSGIPRIDSDIRSPTAAGRASEAAAADAVVPLPCFPFTLVFAADEFDAPEGVDFFFATVLVVASFLLVTFDKRATGPSACGRSSTGGRFRGLRVGMMCVRSGCWVGVGSIRSSTVRSVRIRPHTLADCRPGDHPAGSIRKWNTNESLGSFQSEPRASRQRHKEF